MGEPDGRHGAAGGLAALEEELCFTPPLSGGFHLVLLQKMLTLQGGPSARIFLVMLLGPSLAGLFLEFALDGGAGISALFVKFARWRVGSRYYLLALAAPASALVGRQ